MEDTFVEKQSGNGRIVKNTLILYIRMFFAMLVGLYTSRVVLATLGVEDYGIYGIVGGVLAIMSFLNATMSGAISRFITFEIGRGVSECLSKTFSSALIIQFFFAFLVLVFAETVGLWFLYNKLVIPDGRFDAALWVYQFSVIGFIFSVIQIPYNACLIAHERMDVYAYIEILNVALKLLIVFLLVASPFDKLIFYALLVLAVSIIVMMIYRFYCKHNFKECNFFWIIEKKYLKPIISFSVWEVLGHFGYTFRTQGTNVALNMVFGTIANASSTLASSVQGTLQGFSQNVITAIRPQIVKRYAIGNYDSMAKLMYGSTKVSVFLASITCVPVILNIDYLLNLWLVEVPQYCAVFCQYMLLSNIVASISQVSYIALQANGNIKYSSIIRSVIYTLTPVIIWYCMRYFSYQPEFAYLCIVISQFVIMVIDFTLLKLYMPFFSLLRYIRLTITVIILLLFIFYLCMSLADIITHGLCSFIITSFSSLTLIGLSFYFFVLNSEERSSFRSYLVRTCKRYIKM